MPQLCLGTAQFGLTYGITNDVGQVSEKEVARILAQAKVGGIRWLDTAQAYGTAEAVVGRNLPDGHGFQVIGKLSAQSQTFFTAKDVNAWEKAFLASCERLGFEALDTLLLHAPRDLGKSGKEILEDWLLGLRDRGFVKRLGMSIYNADDLANVSPELLDVVQLPLSLFDQRLLQDGTVAYLRSCGTAIHARSLYLQGLLLTPSSRWPNWVAPEVRGHQKRLENLARDRGCRLIELALGFAKEQPDLDSVVLGVCNVDELIDMQKAWSSISPWQEGEWQSWALNDPKMLDPRCWPQP
jgi:aryl-alcohol dehydrogenase-like predicted oxidoreductase